MVVELSIFSEEGHCGRGQPLCYGLDVKGPAEASCGEDLASRWWFQSPGANYILRTLDQALINPQIDS